MFGKGQLKALDMESGRANGLESCKRGRYIRMISGGHIEALHGKSVVERCQTRKTKVGVEYFSPAPNELISLTSS
jgi:hypothetical protein